MAPPQTEGDQTGGDQIGGYYAGGDDLFNTCACHMMVVTIEVNDDENNKHGI